MRAEFDEKAGRIVFRNRERPQPCGHVYGDMVFDKKSRRTRKVCAICRRVRNREHMRRVRGKEAA